MTSDVASECTSPPRREDSPPGGTAAESATVVVGGIGEREQWQEQQALMSGESIERCCLPGPPRPRRPPHIVLLVGEGSPALEGTGVICGALTSRITADSSPAFLLTRFSTAVRVRQRASSELTPHGRRWMGLRIA